MDSISTNQSAFLPGFEAVATMQNDEDLLLKTAGGKAEIVPFSGAIYTALFYIVAVGGLAISCFGVAANLLIIKTFLAMGVTDGVTALFLSLSCSDLAYVLLTVIRNIGRLMEFFEEEAGGAWLFGTDPLILLFFCDNCAFVMYAISIFVSTFLAVARCMCVTRPLHFKNLFTKGRCLKALIPMYLFPIACQTAIFVNMGVVRKSGSGVDANASRPSLWMSGDRERVKDIIRFMLATVLPLATQVIVVVCVFIMIVKLKESAFFRAGQSATGPPAEKGASSVTLTGKDRQVAKQVLLISIIYNVTNIPKIFCSFLMSMNPHLINFGEVARVLFHFVDMDDLKVLFEVINSSVNIFVYYVYNSKFRSHCFACR